MRTRVNFVNRIATIAERSIQAAPIENRIRPADIKTVTYDPALDELTITLNSPDGRDKVRELKQFSRTLDETTRPAKESTRNPGELALAIG